MVFNSITSLKINNLSPEQSLIWDVLKENWFSHLSGQKMHSAQLLSNLFPVFQLGLQAEALLITTEFWEDRPLGLDHIMKITQLILMKCFEYKSSVQVIMPQFPFLATKSACRLIFFNYKIIISAWSGLHTSAIGVNNSLIKESC